MSTYTGVANCQKTVVFGPRCIYSMRSTQTFCVHLLLFRYLLLSCSIVLFGLTTTRLNKTTTTTTTETSKWKPEIKFQYGDRLLQKQAIVINRLRIELRCRNLQRWSPRRHGLGLEDPRGQLTMSLALGSNSLVLALDCQSLALEVVLDVGLATSMSELLSCLYGAIDIADYKTDCI